ncbi:monovalent cation/H+ antiporter complex subunit F [Alkalitalea saponilacus]|uniref:Multicomponent Na+:H+ antiporter subunit F n=1 Tax=Alkalitalea saponilacus TaxID=889453 RepID=A0A1T5HUG0_9BACT|nr:monovalent cation/H+ antiporter complex subunit F [Alkalitalea saponilacus]ASB50233.1 cation:proton antiporter [Alkalitalea saponilacus]SKC24120.1 multicomponent Na+:H+ antiporter subunit F [Alkalitalea saponilacus]
MESTEFLKYASQIALFIMTVAMLFPMFRLFRGPTLTDRIVALDQMELTIMGMILCYAVYSEKQIYLDVVLMSSFLLAFGAMIITRYLFKRKIEND